MQRTIKATFSTREESQICIYPTQSPLSSALFSSLLRSISRLLALSLVSPMFSSPTRLPYTTFLSFRLALLFNFPIPILHASPHPNQLSPTSVASQCWSKPVTARPSTWKHGYHVTGPVDSLAWGMEGSLDVSGTATWHTPVRWDSQLSELTAATMVRAELLSPIVHRLWQTSPIDREFWPFFFTRCFHDPRLTAD